MNRFRGWPGAAVLALFGFAVSAGAAPPPLEAYGKLPHVERMSLSPSGDKYALIEVTGDARRLVIVPVAGGNPTALDFPVKDKLRDIEWAGDDHIVVTATGTLHDGAVFTVDAIEIAEVLVD